MFVRSRTIRNDHLVAWKIVYVVQDFARRNKTRTRNVSLVKRILVSHVHYHRLTGIYQVGQLGCSYPARAVSVHCFGFKSHLPGAGVGGITGTGVGGIIGGVARGKNHCDADYYHGTNRLKTHNKPPQGH
jgi:hypothetical protein